MITLQQIAYFLTAARAGSLSAAAEAHHIAQPSVSEQIRRLEDELGVTLFQRTNRGLRLTDAGRTFLPHAERIASSIDEATEAVRNTRDLVTGTVSLGTFSTAHYVFFSDVIADFRVAYPGVRVRIVGHNSVEVADAVRDGSLEAGLVALPVDDRGLTVGSTVWTSEAVYVSAEPARVRTPRTIEQVALAPLILPEAHWGNQDPTRRQLAERAQVVGLTIAPIVEVETPAAALELVARGVGDTIVSRPLVALLDAKRRLGIISLDPPLRESFAFVTRRSSRLSPATATLIELVTARLAALHETGAT